MSERYSRGRLSDAGLFFLTMLITVAMCAIWVAASADTAEPSKTPRTTDLAGSL
jgi:hypothetical protein